MILFYKFFLVFYWIDYCLARFNIPDTQCFDGPDFWCLNDTTESLCNFSNKSVGLCGYSNKRCQIKIGDSFCKSSPPAQQQSPFQFNGGITAADDNLFFYYVLSLYWPPSNCPLKYNETADFLRYFCSPYTDIDQPGSERLVLHGLWPTFSTKGNYQGWPQYCLSENQDWSKCHIDGNLCPWKNVTKDSFEQTDYEYCLSVENIKECIINPTDILLPEKERLKIFAPGYLAERNLFFNHEWTKHGSCCSAIFAHNISYYLDYMLNLVDIVTQPGSLTYKYIQSYIGEKIGLEYLVSVLNDTAIISCNSKCEVEEVWMCMNRDESSGLPTQLIPCPAGARNASDSCKKARCEYVVFPLRNPTNEIHSDNSIWINLFLIILILILLKYFLFFCKSKITEKQ